MSRSKSLFWLLVMLQLIIGHMAANSYENIKIPLTESIQINVEGPHRYLEVAGLTGFQPTSIHTKAFIETDIHQSERGSISFWVSPLEDLDVYPRNPYINKNLCYYNLVTDKYPPRNMEKNNFGIYWTNLYPSLVVRYTYEHLWNVLNYGFGPFVYAEALKMRRGQWYHIVHTWNKAEKTLMLYINGLEVGQNYRAENFEVSNDSLYMGNPMMIMRDLRLTTEMFDKNKIEALYQKSRPATNDLADQDVRHEHIPDYLPDVAIQLDSSWQKSYACSFFDEEEFEEWTLQTGDEYRDQFDVRITDEGLLFQTPDKIARQTRMYLWCPKKFEGDGIWIEYDFRLESPEGLALIVMNASGVQHEDYVEDHGLENSGNMTEMLKKYRNYHWEFMRRVCLNRVDVETQHVRKNPWDILQSSCIERFEQDRWYTLRFIKDGNRIVGTIDGKTVFDVTDDPFNYKGPVYNFGRVVLRQMFYTKMRYRNFVVYEKKYKDIKIKE